ncbi:MAG: hypothetical protein WCU00_03860, partial [Candidatus Latescibacterota bacterium]
MRKFSLTFSFLLAVALCPLFLSNAFSQPPAGGPGQRQRMTAEQRLEQLDKQVGGLTADQKKKILAIWEETQKNREQQPPPDGERPNARREQLNQSQQSTRAGGQFGRGLSPEVEKILTPDQVKKYQAYQKKANIERQLERFSEFNLSEDQKKKLINIFEKQNENMQKMMEKTKDMEPQ